MANSMEAKARAEAELRDSLSKLTTEQYIRAVMPTGKIYFKAPNRKRVKIAKEELGGTPVKKKKAHSTLAKRRSLPKKKESRMPAKKAQRRMLKKAQSRMPAKKAQSRMSRGSTILKFNKGGKVDGLAVKGKTRCRMVKGRK